MEDVYAVDSWTWASVVFMLLQAEKGVIQIKSMVSTVNDEVKKMLMAESNNCPHVDVLLVARHVVQWHSARGSFDLHGILKEKDPCPRAYPKWAGDAKVVLEYQRTYNVLDFVPSEAVVIRIPGSDELLVLLTDIEEGFRARQGLLVVGDVEVPPWDLFVRHDCGLELQGGE